MGEPKPHRVDEALSQLVQVLIEVPIGEERHSHGLELARSILERHKNIAIESDVNHVSDLIKKKLLNESESPDKAVEFSDLCTRLLKQPVLQEKWAILYLLYRLSGPDPGDDALSESSASSIEGEKTPRKSFRRSVSSQPNPDSVASKSVERDGTPQTTIRRPESQQPVPVSSKLAERDGTPRTTTTIRRPESHQPDSVPFNPTQRNSTPRTTIGPRESHQPDPVPSDPTEGHGSPKTTKRRSESHQPILVPRDPSEGDVSPKTTKRRSESHEPLPVPRHSSEEGVSPKTTKRRSESHQIHKIPLNLREGFTAAGLPPLPPPYRNRSRERSRRNPSTERANRRKPETFQDAPKELPSQETRVARANPPAERAHRRKPEEVPDGPSERPSREEGGLETIPTEAAFLRDLPFTLQGLSTTHLPFTSSSEVIIPPCLPLPLVSLLHTLVEPSLLYRDLSKFVRTPVKGLIAQSLTSAIGNELRSYLALIATLEGEIRRFIKSVDGGEPRHGVGTVGVTLKRCVVWTREATMGLRLMSLMAERSKSRKGGQLISMVHELSASHGDPFVAAFAERILGCVTTPFYDMLQHWIYDGELVDPFHEFFVIELEPVITEQRETDRRHAPATSGWEDKYKLDDKMIPTIMSSVLVRKVFLIGKSLNFLRYNCLDSAWVEAYCKDATRELHYGDTATLQASIDKAYRATMAQVTHLMDKKFHLFEHLRALKRYILLGEGDFIALLMDSVAPNLDRPAGSQYRHTLTAQLEHAIRGSNAQYENPDILRRLDVRVLELNTGDIGWDVFALEYRVDAPVNVVITPWANRKYLTMFNFLWRVKRVEFALRSTWRRIMTGARGVLANVDDGTDRDWKAARCCMAEMIHLVNQLQYYILFEVIEASWDQLQAAITKPNCTLDDLIGAHAKYLESITRKGLLGPARHALTGGREESFPSQLHYLLKNMLAYRDVVDGLYSFSVSNFTNRQERSVVDDARDPTRGNARGFNPRDESLRSPSPFTAKRTYLLTKERTDSPFPANEVLPGVPLGEDKDQMLTALRVRLAELSTEFRTRVTTFLRDLAVQPDVNMKFLGVVMNFNGVYGPRKKVEQVPPPGEEDEESDDEIEGVIDFVKGHGGGAGGGIDGRSEVAVGTVRAGGEGDGGGNDDGADADVDDVSSRPASKEKGKRKEKEKEELSSKEDEIPALQRRRTRHVRDRDRDKERDKVVDVK